MGTLVYMSPEQASSQEISTASDIYSVAVIMQKLLTGDYPYTFTDTNSLHKQIIDAHVIQLDSLPKDYQALIKSMTAKDPLDRPTALELKLKLTAIKNKPLKKKQNRRNYIIGFILTFLLSSAHLATVSASYSKTEKSELP